jgi:hypothetical protein
MKKTKAKVNKKPGKPAVKAVVKPTPAAVAKSRPHEGLLKSIGGTVGKMFGPEASTLGAEAGDLLGRLFGWGDYEMVPPVNYPIQTNSVLGLTTPLASQIPLMHGSEGCVRVQKREYIKDVKMSASFNVPILIPLNPLDPQFPWLSKIAVNFEQFKWLGLAFGFRSLSANALGTSGSPSMGSVTIVTQYDALDVAPGTKTQANNALYSTSCKPAESMLHPVECDPEQTPVAPLYTGANEQVSTNPQFARDPRLSYHGFTSVCTQGAPGAADGYLCGELWVTYDVMFYKPYARGPFDGGDRLSVLETHLRSAKETVEEYETIRPPPPLVRR